jgi:hypothetical protein
MAAIWPAQIAEFHRQEGAPAFAALQRLPQQHLVVAHPVEIAGIEKRNPGIESSMNGGDALGIVDRAVPTRHAHATETDG